jgi:hypothetical protein
VRRFARHPRSRVVRLRDLQRNEPAACAIARFPNFARAPAPRSLEYLEPRFCRRCVR